MIENTPIRTPSSVSADLNLCPEIAVMAMDTLSRSSTSKILIL
jgi:hypothetical protein